MWTLWVIGAFLIAVIGWVSLCWLAIYEHRQHHKHRE